MLSFASRPLLLMLLTALRLPAGALALALAYELPEELLALASLSSSSSSSSSSASSSCHYPVNYTLTDFTSFSPRNATSNSSSVSYISFTFADSSTEITTPCAYNASSVSLTAGTGLADRYACDNSLVSLIWQRGKLTLIEVTCPGQTSTVYEASGSVTPTGLQCSTSTNGTLCTAAAPLTADFTSDEPSPLQSTSTTSKIRRARRQLPIA